MGEKCDCGCGQDIEGRPTMGPGRFLIRCFKVAIQYSARKAREESDSKARKIRDTSTPLADTPMWCPTCMNHMWARADSMSWWCKQCGERIRIITERDTVDPAPKSCPACKRIPATKQCGSGVHLVCENPGCMLRGLGFTLKRWNNWRVDG